MEILFAGLFAFISIAFIIFMIIDSRDSKEEAAERKSVNKIRREYTDVENPQTPPRKLIELFSHDSWTVRELLATNPNTPPHIRHALAADSNKWVRHTLAKSELAEFRTLRLLLNDESEWVSRAAEDNLSAAVPPMQHKPCCNCHSLLG